MIVREEGLENTWARHRTLAAAVHAAVDVWSGGGALHANVADPAERSVAVTTVLAPGTDMAALREWTQEHAGLTLGLGIFKVRAATLYQYLLPFFLEGQNKTALQDTEWEDAAMLNGDSVFRIGHMGHLNPVMLLGALGTIESGLSALGVPIGTGGVAAAVQVIAGSGGPGVGVGVAEAAVAGGKASL